MKKKLFWFISTLILGIILAAVLIPFIYKDEIKQYITDQTNENINATVQFSDVDISLFRSFPSLRITIDSLVVSGIDTFDGIRLYAAPKTEIDINLPSVIGKNKIPEINNIHAIRPEINIEKKKKKRANYLIQKEKSSQGTSTFKLSIQKYKITDGSLTYQDNAMNLLTRLSLVSHEGSGDFTQDEFDLVTKTEVGDVYLQFDGTEYFNGAKATLNSKIKINLKDEIYSLLDNILKINDLDIVADGKFSFTDQGIYNDVTFKTASESFKSFLSLIPGAYTKNFKDVQAQGTASFSGFVKGIYNGDAKQYPSFALNTIVKNGAVKYPDLKQRVSNVNADLRIKAEKSDWSDLALAIPSFNLNINKDFLSGKVILTEALANQSISGYIKANLNLSNLTQAFPLEQMEYFSGKLDCDLNFDAKVQDIKASNYEKIKFSGQGTGTSIRYKTKNYPSIAIQNVYVSASPSKLTVEFKNMTMGKSDMNIYAGVENPLAFLIRGKKLNTDLKISSGYLDINEWTIQSPTATANSEVPMSIDEHLLKESGLTLDMKIKKVIFQDKTIDNLSLNGTISANALKVNQLSADIQNSDISLKGTVINAYDYLVNNEVLDGELEFYANNFNANQFLTSGSEKSASPTAVIPVPERVRVRIDTKIKNLQYTNLHLKDFQGVLEVKNREVALKNLETNMLGGQLSLEGLYNTTDLTKPDFAVKLDLSKIAFNEAISKIEMFQKVAPIAAYINGVFNTSIVMRGKLGGTMMPDLSTLDASGLFETLNGTIKGNSPMAELSQKTGIKELSEISLNNTKNWFEIIQGFMELKPYTTKIKGIDFTISGKHGFGKEMDYKINLIIPREIVKKNRLIALGEAGWSNIEKEASKLGINIQQGSQIYLDVQMTGPFRKPVFKITPRNSAGSTYKEALESQANDIVKNVTDSVKTEIKKKETELRDTISKRANEELEKVKSKAEKVADKAIDSIKTVAKDQVIGRLDSLTKGVISDSLKQKAKDVFDKKSTEEVEKIKEKLKDFNPFKNKKEGGGG